MAATTSSGARCGCTRPRDCVDRRDGRYLTAAYWLAGEESGRISTGAVSDRLGVTPATVTEMFDRLDGHDLVDYRKHAGIRLTDRGTAIARELARRQCLVRAYFARELGVAFGADEGFRVGYILPADGVETLEGLIDADSGDHCDYGERRETRSDDGNGADRPGAV